MQIRRAGQRAMDAYPRALTDRRAVTRRAIPKRCKKWTQYRVSRLLGRIGGLRGPPLW